MKKIKILHKSVAQKIAAGEVVERPSSVVKELLENSIDAGSTFITVEIEEGGKKLIRISDNGSGIRPDDVELAFIRHATSKIETESDLYNIKHMGFRGEALYSISAVSKTTMITKTHDDECGKKVVVHGGEIVENSDYGCPNGTTILIEDLFYNTPARKKFMKSNSAETSQIASIVQKIILSRPDVSIKLISNNALIYHSSGDASLTNAIFSIYGKKVASNITEFDDKYENIRIYGALGNRDSFRSSRINQTLFANLRFVKDKEINRSIEAAYGTLLMKGKFPFYVVFVEVNTNEIDVNVHPQKLFVKFSNMDKIKECIYNSVKTFTNKLGATPDILLTQNNTDVKVEPVRRAYSFEKKISVESSILPIENLRSNSESNKKHENIAIKNYEKDTFEIKKDNEVSLKTDINKENTTKVVNSDKEFIPRKYDYKKEIEIKKAMKQPLILKQNTVELNIEQRTYFEDLAEARVVGTAFNSFILVEYGEDLYFIDQHAAHERFLYEKLYEQYKKDNVISQQLLIPQLIDVTYEEKVLIKDFIVEFERLGFMINVNNDLSVQLLAVPHILGQPKFQGFFVDLLDLVSKEGRAEEESIIEKIISMSCKRAVKAGDELSKDEICNLIDNIKDEEVPLTCPHGRPFVMRITKKQIDKRVGRIV